MGSACALSQLWEQLVHLVLRHMREHPYIPILNTLLDLIGFKARVWHLKQVLNLTLVPILNLWAPELVASNSNYSPRLDCR